ncbi:MAG: 4Fe-4S ferredoxin [Pseudodesulfovibrio sp.]|uniref:Electron transfer flavoprotein-ubiquinone oxidoreductase n=1 Tax=Pseudodesulfovibrio aespoeensis (strain ATCC 700646 / DSM 10631 / Aspo-2) TaxID=643562 RepID=E6VWA4_PSEA9|nr:MULTISPECIES: 4Fe-4S ferredoxin [Pseudodesulfovibrio]MBU4192986.1 4Fe-4S ferredoxin [Pseudomonadota bacterium]ADU63664.1 Electron-transferring-flavoprotein dehydrogenase [Pseudodesulfovibrio aespoeensis Aspo-2]MBU4244947.1 4Fe-4S ferredoxin [Pseudomonadota bacterium]MBU4378063.1 4Fe-4S ferredoxin [Pseudomonadota bacterium]MBU4475550.1 4Fe-4S ferredoxin [Pseudomonadota bacterium]
MSDSTDTPEVPRAEMETDIVCVGFGPAAGGFLTTLTRGLKREDGTPAVESAVMPGMPPQVICYERADDIGFGVSGVVTKGRAIRASFPDLDLSQIPMAHEVTDEKVVYLRDPVGASRRPGAFRLADKALSRWMEDDAFELPYVPPFLKKHPGMIFSIGQFNQWVGSNLMGTGLAQIWPGSPVAAPLMEGRAVRGVRMVDQGVGKDGALGPGSMPGMDMKAALTVVADGPVGPVGRHLDRELGLPEGNHQHEWAIGMKCVVDLPEGCDWQPGTVLHTIGYPEPEIFGFLYVYPGNVASLGIFVPSWFDNPVRTAYRSMQHWMLHPYLWKRLQGGTMRSWGAKSLQESGRRGEPFLCGDGFARIGEGSGSTNVLTGSGVDEAWATGVMLGEAVLELMQAGKPYTRENLEAAYVARRRASWVEAEAKVAEKSRDGFTASIMKGFLGMALTGLTNGLVNMPGSARKPQDRIPTVEDYYKGYIAQGEIREIRAECARQGKSLHDALMDRVGWPQIPLDGTLLVSHQDALLMGGKVQAAPGYADHVRFADPYTCEACREQVCIEACSGQAITVNTEGGAPLFDREKCVHCGACIWNCSKSDPKDKERTNVRFGAGSGGLHSVEN